MNLSFVETPSQLATPAGTVIWLHGVGASGRQLESMVPLLGLPQLRFILPNAPAMPLTIHGGAMTPAWFDIRSFAQIDDFAAEDQLRRATAGVEALLQREVQRGVPSKSIVLAGFSQGAGLALYAGLRCQRELRGIVSLSGYVPLPSRLPAESTEANRRTPILFCHGTRDPVVPLFGGRQFHDYVVSLQPDRDVRWHEFPMGHEICVPELATVGAWLRETFFARP